MIRYILVVIICLTFLVFLGITRTVIKTEEIQTTVSFTNEIQPILTASCAEANCHAGAEPWMDLNLESEYSYENLVNRPSNEVSGVKIVHPFKLKSSYLLHKIKGIQAKGARMPYKKESLTKQEIALIQKWIKQGALRN